MAEKTTTASGGEEIKITGNPIPTRYDEAEERLIRRIAKLTGMPQAQVIQRCARFALPKFASGEVNILTLTESTELAPGSRAEAGA